MSVVNTLRLSESTFILYAEALVSTQLLPPCNIQGPWLQATAMDLSDDPVAAQGLGRSDRPL